MLKLKITDENWNLTKDSVFDLWADLKAQKEKWQEDDWQNHNFTIEIEDNNFSKGETIGTQLIAPLERLANRSLEEIQQDEEFKDIFVVSDAKRNKESNLLKSSIFTFEKDRNNPEIGVLKTGNVMGYIGAGNVQLKIKSRFDDSSNDFFLHYMLEKVFHVNLVQLRYGNSNIEMLDFLYLMFPYYLKKAVKQGILRQYVDIAHNDSAIKGTIDVPRHIRQNIPFVGKIAYNTHEYNTDNSLTQLVRHTIEFIRKKPIGKHILYERDTRKAVQEIVLATPSYAPDKQKKLIETNRRPVAHPYYTEYDELKKICIQILTHNKLSYKDGKPTINGILFDGAWLWEEYVATILTDFKHPRNDIRDGGIPLFKNPDNDGADITKSSRKTYPDFYKKKDTQMQYILDAKYKKQNEKGIFREDLYQVIAYMYTTKCEWGGYIYPYQESNDNDKPYRCYELAGYGGSLYSIPVSIPPTDTEKEYGDFCSEMKNREEEIEEAFGKKFKVSVFDKFNTTKTL